MLGAPKRNSGSPFFNHLKKPNQTKTRAREAQPRAGSSRTTPHAQGTPGAHQPQLTTDWGASLTSAGQKTKPSPYSHAAHQAMPLTPLARNRKEILFLQNTKPRLMLYLTLRRFMSAHSFQTASSPQRPEGPARPRRAAPRSGHSSALRSEPPGEPRPALSGREGGFAKALENRKIYRAPADLCSRGRALRSPSLPPCAAPRGRGHRHRTWPRPRSHPAPRGRQGKGREGRGRAAIRRARGGDGHRSARAPREGGRECGRAGARTGRCARRRARGGR